ncbi:SDR family NAD(P)-dependent oxidoreductase [Sphingomonas naphthae]|uniref:SDR family NAD(P)-dependent oxidoreductase n=1 Tax=Sphingomonas naphthae TaxID=1813468 RepID=A0ABY7TNZ8_9SPHN|nr:SDR family oxidoreductase [Sphingomonas naphthae]WCT74655.1 SDR family NAD(P)-dependent oxidoreductase [Sphingomonas naphthae]
MNTDRTVLLTGAAGGMGAVFVQRFLGNGDTVVATDTSGEALGALLEKMGESDRLIVVQGDISDDASCREIAETARTKTGRIDVLVNVAGFFPIQPFLDISADDWRKIIDINLTGTAFMTKAALPLMVGRGWGRIINVGSASVYPGVPGQSHYVAAKAGVIGLTRSLAREFGRDGITVNLVAPGVTVTKAVKESFPEELLKEQIERRCIRREEKPDDLVGTVFFLASPDADFITGQSIIIDGGSLML